MNQDLNNENVNYKEERADMRLHFIGGYLRLDDQTLVPSALKGYKATIYADTYMGIPEESDLLIEYYESEKRVCISIQSMEGKDFYWESDEKNVDASVMVYLLTDNSEFLLYRDCKDGFCLLMRPRKDPRGKVTHRTANPHLNSIYRILDTLLLEKAKYNFKCKTRWEV